MNANRGRTHIIRLLLRAGADPEHRAYDGDTAEELYRTQTSADDARPKGDAERCYRSAKGRAAGGCVMRSSRTTTCSFCVPVPRRARAHDARVVEGGEVVSCARAHGKRKPPVVRGGPARALSASYRCDVLARPGVRAPSSGLSLPGNPPSRPRSAPSCARCSSRAPASRLAESPPPSPRSPPTPRVPEAAPPPVWAAGGASTLQQQHSAARRPRPRVRGTPASRRKGVNGTPVSIDGHLPFGERANGRG